MGITADKLGRKAIKIVDNIVNFMILTVIVLLIAFAGYALWDSEQINQAADKSNYSIYKPQAADEGKSFKELQAINPEVFAWLSVYGTNIDYPVTQGANNLKYVNTNAEGQYSLSGAIFLDCGNSKDFSDFNSILYGHHMEKKTMFGEIGRFADSDMFDSRRYGNLYFDEKDHGIEFFSFIHTDAYNSSVYAVGVKGSARQAYLDGLLAQALHQRNIEVTADDHIILLSTCSASSTNGRDILIGKITAEVYEDTFLTAETDAQNRRMNVDRRGSFLEHMPLWLVLLIIIILIVLRRLMLNNIDKKRGRKI
jgi:sortase B